MTVMRFWGILFFSMVFSHYAFSQELKLVKGIIADSATFSPLPYVSIQIKNSARGTSSDIKGNFGILANTLDTLMFSYIGYKTLELPVVDWEPSVILMAEQTTVLQSITIRSTALDEPYEYLFEEENNRLKKSTKKLPFYYAKDKKEKIQVQRFKNENQRVNTYVDLLINNSDAKNDLMKKYKISEHEYYSVLAQFNEKNYRIMYYLTTSELLSLLNRFYETHAPKK